MYFFVPEILRTSPALNMAVRLSSFREVGFTLPPYPFKSISLSPVSRQLQSLHLDRSNNLAFPFRHEWHVTCSSFPSTATEDFQRLWVTKVYQSLHAMASFATTVSQVLSAIVVFLHHKAMDAKVSGSLFFCKLCHGDGNAFLAETNGRSLSRRPLNCIVENGGLALALMSTVTLAKDHINPVITTLCANPTFMSGLAAWALAQVLKVFATFFVERKWDFKILFGSGGMPSSHSALCVALTTSVALCHGISDSLFPACLGFSLIVMYDAIGVRRHAGMQAEVLNLIVEDLFQGHPISQKKLKELVGQTPLQVGAGAFVGITAGYLCSQGYVSFSGNGFKLH